MKLHLAVKMMIPLILVLGSGSWVSGQDPTPVLGTDTPTIGRAVMCESMDGATPKNVSLVFSIAIGKVVCFTAFDQVPREMAVYHSWYRKDQLNTKRKLLLKPPRWAAFTEIQLRETDKGPWRVEVTDENGTVLHILRFSITD